MSLGVSLGFPHYIGVFFIAYIYICWFRTFIKHVVDVELTFNFTPLKLDWVLRLAYSPHPHPVFLGSIFTDSRISLLTFSTFGQSISHTKEEKAKARKCFEVGKHCAATEFLLGF